MNVGLLSRRCTGGLAGNFFRPAANSAAYRTTAVSRRAETRDLQLTALPACLPLHYAPDITQVRRNASLFSDLYSLALQLHDDKAVCVYGEGRRCQRGLLSYFMY